MIVSDIKLYELLKAKIGAREASAFVEILETKVSKKFEDAKIVLATKKDIANTKEDIANVKVEVVRWVFAFFATLALMIIGLYFKK